MRYSQNKMEPAGSVTVELLTNISQLTTIIRLAKYVDSYAPRAIKRWASLGTTPSASLRQQLISSYRQHEKYWESGTGRRIRTSL